MLFFTIQKLSVAKETKQWVQFVLLSSYKVSYSDVNSINVIWSSCKVPDIFV
jgi:hypothetical protein